MALRHFTSPERKRRVLAATRRLRSGLVFRSSAAALAVMLLLGTARADDPDPVGKTAAEWKLDDWIHSDPLTLKGLRGKVVLVRWWAYPDCPFCKATAPALNEFHKKYAGRGLTVVGAYHHKAKTPLKLDGVKQAAKALAFEFPVAVDHDWKTLKEWWLSGEKRRWTSVTFLIDRKGVVRHVHPGGAYAQGDDGHRMMQTKIEELLNEK